MERTRCFPCSDSPRVRRMQALERRLAVARGDEPADGVNWLLDATSGLQLEVLFMAPSCVPASPFESPRRPLTGGDLEALMRRRRMLGLAEMMNFPGVVDGLPSELEKLGLEGARHVD